jgi:hypothetical protein
MYLYAGGGELDERSAERYNPRTDKWTEIPSMRTPRLGFATAVMDDKIFAIAGYNGNTSINNVECFDKRTNEWFVCYFRISSRTVISESQLSGTFSVKISLMECYRVVSYKLVDISEVLTASIIRSMSKPREKRCESGMLQ